MRIAVKSGKIDAVRADLLVLGHFGDDDPLPPVLKRIDRSLGGVIGESLASREFRGKKNELLLLHTMGRLPARRLMLVGLGDRKEFALDTLRRAAATAAVRARKIRAATIAVDGELKADGGHGADRIARTIVEGARLGLYRFRDYKARAAAKEEEPEVRSLQIVVEGAAAVRKAREGVRTGEIVADSVVLSRDLDNRPGNCATPEYLARQARSIARKYGLTCRVMTPRELERMKMGAILAVGGGSRSGPRLIVLRHRGGGASGEHIVLVGKGITFDSGGISIKPGPDMDKMKYDKSGGVVVLGVMAAVARLGLPLDVTGIVPAAENLPGGSAYRPGDILTTYSGKTVEILNTDAEGRLVLADALAWAQTLKPTAMIDIATLTGACVIALGSVAAGVMGNDDALIEALRESGGRTGERVWPLPLWDEYAEQLKSVPADLKNVGGRDASVITAGMFLKEFAGEVPWAHLDVAGTSWSTKGGPYIPRGPSGMGVRLLLDYLEVRAANAKGPAKRAPKRRAKRGRA